MKLKESFATSISNRFDLKRKTRNCYWKIMETINATDNVFIDKYRAYQKLLFECYLKNHDYIEQARLTRKLLESAVDLRICLSSISPKERSRLTKIYDRFTYGQIRVDIRNIIDHLFNRFVMEIDKIDALLQTIPCELKYSTSVEQIRAIIDALDSNLAYAIQPILSLGESFSHPRREVARAKMTAMRLEIFKRDLLKIHQLIMSKIGAALAQHELTE